jgi:molecular chaperone HtpG
MEINPNHKLIKKLTKMSKSKDSLGKVEDVALLLYEQSRIVEGDKPSDPIAFSKKLIETLTASVDS